MDFFLMKPDAILCSRCFVRFPPKQITPKIERMGTIMSLGFEFKGREYYSLIRVKERNEKTEYHVTVMNGELERLLYGNHIINEINGQLEIESIPENSEQCKLKKQIARALNRHLHIN
jgi:hypothetical protein